MTELQWKLLEKIALIGASGGGSSSSYGERSDYNPNSITHTYGSFDPTPDVPKAGTTMINGKATQVRKATPKVISAKHINKVATDVASRILEKYAINI